MPAYMVSYDLSKPDRDYESLFDALKEYGTWWHNLESTWIVITDESAKSVRDKLKNQIDSNDKLLVARLSGESAWTGFSDKASKWLKDNL